jgi:4'-phosphopantetheinyl transferase
MRLTKLLETIRASKCYIIDCRSSRNFRKNRASKTPPINARPPERKSFGLQQIEDLGAPVDLWLIDAADEAALPSDPSDLLSADEIARANRFHFAKDRTSFILTHAALRKLLGKAVGLPPKQIAFDAGPYGKPYLATKPELHFNLSHSGSLALIGISASRPIGVDIEAMRENIDELALARSFFCENEYRFLTTLEGETRMQAFYKIWTCKEAVLKAFGVGISMHLKDFTVALNRDGYRIDPDPRYFRLDLAQAQVRPVKVPTGYAAAFALA